MSEPLTKDEAVAACLRVLTSNDIDYDDSLPAELLDELERAELYKASLAKWKQA